MKNLVNLSVAVALLILSLVAAGLLSNHLNLVRLLSILVFFLLLTLSLLVARIKDEI